MLGFSRGTARACPPDPPALESCLLGEFAHRTVNDLSCASAAVRLARRRTCGSEQRDVLDQLAARLDALGRLQRLMQAPEPGRLVDLAEQLQALGQAMAVARYADRNIALRLIVEDMVVEAGRGWRILMVLAELLVNAARHAFDDAGGAVLAQVFSRGGDIVCQVRDSGRGWSGGLARRAGYGASVVRMLVEEMGGELTLIPSALGTSVQVTVPGGWDG
jgi:two-component sensor histidine kinase